MGIPTYFSYIVKNHFNIIKIYNANTMQINNFYLDCNSIIYDCIRNIDFSTLVDTDINTIIKAVCRKIEEYIRILNPNNIIFIAFDGVAPVAKLEQQRSRRYKSLYQNNIAKGIFKDTKPDPWNTTAITPGTVFMNQLNSEIKKVFNNPSVYNVKQIILSTSDIHGEGEHKIFEYIRNFPEYNKNQNIVVYGLDADLIMLAINHLPVSNSIYLYRETPDYIKSINIELEPNKSYIIDIPELARIITLDMNNQVISATKELDVLEPHNRVYDYIFLCFFLGNDFMPHFPAVNIATGGIDKLLNAYKVTIGNTNDILNDGKTIYWKNVQKLVAYIALNEEEFLKAETKLRDRKSKYVLPSDTPEEQFKKFDAIPMYERTTEKYINPYKVGWQERYYQILFDIEIDDVRRKQICMNYLQGLEWTMKYYTVDCPDWRWCYKYHYPPLFIDLVKYIPYFETELVKSQPARPVNNLVQLSYVLPKQSLYLLPTNVYTALLKEHNDWYKMNCKFTWAYCRYFWEAHVDLPNIDIDELEDFINKKIKK